LPLSSFTNGSEAERAVVKLNNCVPNDLTPENLKGKVSPLKVMSKNKWLELKEEFKKIKNELVKHLDPSISKEQIIGCLVQLKHLPADTDKVCIKAAVSNFTLPKYVDYKKGTSTAIIRFENPTIAKAFQDKYSLKDFILNGKKIEMGSISGETETEYLEKIRDHRNNLRKHFLEIKQSKIHYSFGDNE